MVKITYILVSSSHAKCSPLKYWWSALSSKVCKKIRIRPWWRSYARVVCVCVFVCVCMCVLLDIHCCLDWLPVISDHFLGYFILPPKYFSYRSMCHFCLSCFYGSSDGLFRRMDPVRMFQHGFEHGKLCWFEIRYAISVAGLSLQHFFHFFSGESAITLCQVVIVPCPLSTKTKLCFFHPTILFTCLLQHLFFHRKRYIRDP